MAGLFSESTLDQVRAANDIVDVIGAVLPLKRAGANFVALCPFHKEKTPSFNVNPQRQIFHCFGCHKGGNVFKFIQEYENLSFPEAVRRLADRAKIPLEQAETRGQAQSRSLKDALIGLHEQLTQHWQNALAQSPAGQAARNYLAKRGVSTEAVQLFRLGYAPDAWDDTVEWVKSHGYEPSMGEVAGVLIRKEGLGEAHYYDRFRGRLMFPICDEQGRVIAFSGRILSGDEKVAKYVNSPETPIFIKSKVFYGLDKSKRPLLDQQFAVVCEGQLDAIACYMAGVQNVVAPQGTAFTHDHANILKRYVPEVVLCFDADTAGQTAAIRVFDHLVAAGLAIRVAVLPAPHDPDSYIKNFGPAAFQTLIKQAPGFFDFYLDRLCAQNDLQSDRGQLAVTQAMAEVLQKSDSKVLLDKYAQKTALKLGVSIDAIRAELGRAASPTRRPAPAKIPALPPPPPRPSTLEFWLLKVLFLHDDLAPWLADHLDLEWVQHATARSLIARRLAAHEEHTWTGAAGLLNAIDDDSTRSLLTEILAEERPLPHPQQQMTDSVMRLRNQAIDREIAAIRVRIANPALPELEKVECLQRLLQLSPAKARPLASRHPTE